MNLKNEERMVARGKERLTRRQQAAARIKQATSIPGGPRHVMQEAASEVAAGLRRWLRRSGPGRHGVARPLLKLVKPEAAAVIVCRTVIDSINRSGKATTTAVTVGARVEDEIRFKQFRREAPGLVGRVEERFKLARSKDYRYRRAVLAETQSRASDVTQWVPWTVDQKLHVGASLIERMMEAGYIEKYHKSDGKRMKLLLVASLKLIEGMKRGKSGMKLMPWFMPMTEPPVDWTNTHDGGYITHRVGLVKDHGAGWVTDESNLGPTLDAINAVQNTPWQVNEDVLVVAEELFKLGHEQAGLPASEALPDPPPPLWLGDTKVSDLPPDLKAEFKKWKRAVANTRTNEIRRRSHVIAVRTTLDLAEELKDKPALYFPHQLDWRGRMYPMPLYLEPQGRDLSRGLLRFAEGKPVGKGGGEWLAIHGANCWGLDKVPFGERVEWVLNSEDMLRRVFDDPITNREWMEADAPFQFLAWVLEWVPFLNSGCSEEFVSHLAVSMDGSCNGLQHFSAMLRDERGGRAVNLTPTEEPQDIYGEVALEVEDAVIALARTGDEWAQRWLASSLIDRKVVKRQVMTLPYGVTQVGATWQLTHYLQQYGGPFAGLTSGEASKWLSPIIWEAIGKVATASRQAMEYLQGVARACVETGQPLRWTTPHGLVIEQAYYHKDLRVVKTQLLGRVDLTLREPTNRLDKRKQQSAVAPNFVHSFDAAHLCSTINWCTDLEAGVSWAVVHDSFGCHAADAPLLAEVLRVTFVEQYRNHGLDNLLIPEGTEVPEQPPRGKLNLEQVIRADFFFA